MFHLKSQQPSCFFSDECEIQGLEKVVTKYCDHMSNNRSQKKLAILVQMSMLIRENSDRCRKSIEEIGNAFVNILDSLLVAKMIGLAGRFLYICQTQLKVRLFTSVAKGGGEPGWVLKQPFT